MSQTEMTQYTYISVDVETAGPNPGTFSLLSIGACTLGQPQQTFYIELQPVNDQLSPEAYAIHGLSLEALRRQGQPPAQAMQQFEAWVLSVTPAGQKPLFVAFNAPFDWMFVADYFYRYLGHNPFGHTALDIKAFYMGQAGVSWEKTSMRHLRPQQSLSHHALQDAQEQAAIFAQMLRLRSPSEETIP